MEDRLWITDEVASHCRVPASTVRYWRSHGTGPRYLKVGRRVVYRESDVKAWLDQSVAVA